MKRLVRLDTGESVRGPEPLTDEDRQGAMKFAEAQEATDVWASSSDVPPNVAVRMDRDDKGLTVWRRVKKEADQDEPASKAA